MRTLYHSDIYVSFGEGVFHLERVASIKFNWLLYEIRLSLFERIANFNFQKETLRLNACTCIVYVRRRRKISFDI